MLGLPMSPKEFSDTINIFLDFHRTYLFRVMFFDSGLPLKSKITGALTTQLVSTTSTPVSTTGAISLGWQGSKVKVAGKTDYTDWNVTIRDDSVNVAYSYFQEWRDRVYNLKEGTSKAIISTTLLSLDSGYKKSAIVILLSNSLQDSKAEIIGDAITKGLTTRAYIIRGIWPKEIGAIALDYSTENISTFPVTFSVDYFEPYSLTQTV